MTIERQTPLPIDESAMALPDALIARPAIPRISGSLDRPARQRHNGAKRPQARRQALSPPTSTEAK